MWLLKGWLRPPGFTGLCCGNQESLNDDPEDDHSGYSGVNNEFPHSIFLDFAWQSEITDSGLNN